jgi:hypothetical protein
LVGKHKEKILLEVLYIDERIILKWILKTYNGRVWIVLIWLRTGTGGGFCEYGKQLLGSVQSEEFLTSRGTISFTCRTLHHIVI